MASKVARAPVAAAPGPETDPRQAAGVGETGTASHADAVAALFATQFPRLHRLLNRLSADPDLAADLAQDAFVRLLERGWLPESPTSWLITVALNRFRNTVSKRARRRGLLTAERASRVLADPPASPARATDTADVSARVRAALDRLTERDRQMLLLCAEGYRYREIAAALGINEASVGTLLARAKRAFRAEYGGDTDAP
jgi:RNA polymerase sigma-70 factor (ECF subfamily)